MKTIGIIGGMSWESTLTYYKVINEIVKNELGGLNSAKILLYSVNFKEIETLQASGEWQKCGEILVEIAKKLELGGADFIIISTNTMHKVADFVASKIGIGLFHIIDATAISLKQSGFNKITLLGTKYTLKESFYTDKLRQNGFEILLPNDNQIEIINDIIFDELCRGIISEKSRQIYIDIISSLKSLGARAVVLGCTEIGLLIDENCSPLPVFDTALIHAKLSALKSIGVQI
ncbi:MAG: aspartate/glutamate racemase family protein [Campylobacter sp.]|nr:aspartate/glutamate racemase family protein [Campylobacter sp.]